MLHSSTLNACCLLKKICQWRLINGKIKSSIRIHSHSARQRNSLLVILGSFIKLFTKCCNVYVFLYKQIMYLLKAVNTRICLYYTNLS